MFLEYYIGQQSFAARSLLYRYTGLRGANPSYELMLKIKNKVVTMTTASAGNRVQISIR
jgi:hypothetical protein